MGLREVVTLFPSPEEINQFREFYRLPYREAQVLTKIYQSYLSQLKDLIDHYKDKTTLYPGKESINNIILLFLRQQGLTKLPDDIGSLTELAFLDVSENPIHEIPESLGNLKQLRAFNIRGTEILNPQTDTTRKILHTLEKNDTLIIA